MENNQFSVEAIREFISNVIQLTKHYKIKWDIMRPEYDNTTLFQSSLSVRITAEFFCRKFTLISKDDKYNFEVIFNDNPDIIEELPFVTDDAVQGNLKELYEYIINDSKPYNDFNKLFDKAKFEASH